MYPLHPPSQQDPDRIYLTPPFSLNRIIDASENITFLRTLYVIDKYDKPMFERKKTYSEWQCRLISSSVCRIYWVEDIICPGSTEKWHMGQSIPKVWKFFLEYNFSL